MRTSLSYAALSLNSRELTTHQTNESRRLRLRVGKSRFAFFLTKTP